MNRNILNITALFFCGLLTSCFGVFYIDLGNHYAWLEERMIVKIKEEKQNSLSCDYLIYPQVLNFDYDNKYIIVYQVYDGSEYYYIDPRVEKRDSLLAQFEKVKKIKNCYWIIDKEANRVMGPMTKPEFDRRCEALHVKAKLRKIWEKKFWKHTSMEETYPDSSRRKDPIEIMQAEKVRKEQE